MARNGKLKFLQIKLIDLVKIPKERIDLTEWILSLNRASDIERGRYRSACVTYYITRQVKRENRIINKMKDLEVNEITIVTYRRKVFGSSMLFCSMIHHLWK